MAAASIVAGSFAVAIGLLAFFAGPEQTPDTTSSPPVSSQSTTSTTLSAAELAALEYEADVQLISRLWANQTVAWTEGFDRGLTFWVENNYPDMGCSSDDYMQTWFPNGPVEGLRIERVANANTIRADDGWVIPGGKLEGEIARGRVYVMEVSDKFIEPGADPQPARIRSFHVTILDGLAHFFIGCQT